jgi:hypothetical protein
MQLPGPHSKRTYKCGTGAQQHELHGVSMTRPAQQPTWTTTWTPQNQVHDQPHEPSTLTIQLSNPQGVYKIDHMGSPHALSVARPHGQSTQT